MELSHCARTVADADWRGTLRWRVLRERRSNHDSREPIMLPRNVRSLWSYRDGAKIEISILRLRLIPSQCSTRPTFWQPKRLQASQNAHPSIWCLWRVRFRFRETRNSWSLTRMEYTVIFLNSNPFKYEGCSRLTYRPRNGRDIEAEVAQRSSQLAASLRLYEPLDSTRLVRYLIIEKATKQSHLVCIKLYISAQSYVNTGQ